MLLTTCYSSVQSETARFGLRRKLARHTGAAAKSIFQHDAHASLRKSAEQIFVVSLRPRRLDGLNAVVASLSMKSKMLQCLQRVRKQASCKAADLCTLLQMAIMSSEKGLNQKQGRRSQLWRCTRCSTPTTLPKLLKALQEVGPGCSVQQEQQR